MGTGSAPTHTLKRVYSAHAAHFLGGGQIGWWCNTHSHTTTANALDDREANMLNLNHGYNRIITGEYDTIRVRPCSSVVRSIRIRRKADLHMKVV